MLLIYKLSHTMTQNPQNAIFDIRKATENVGTEPEVQKILEEFETKWLTKDMMKALFDSVMVMNFKDVFSTCYGQREGLE